MSNKDVEYLKKCFNMDSSPEMIDTDTKIIKLTEEVNKLKQQISMKDIEINKKENELKEIFNKLSKQNNYNKYINVCPVCANYVNKDTDNFKEFISKHRMAHIEYFICPHCQTSFKLLDVPNEYINYTKEDIANKRELEIPIIKDALYELESKFDKYVYDLTEFKNEINKLNNIS